MKKYKVHKIQLKSVENDVTHTHTQSRKIHQHKRQTLKQTQQRTNLQSEHLILDYSKTRNWNTHI